MTNLIKLQHETIEKVTNLLKTYKEVEAIFIMGSHSRGEESSFSDIDIGFIFTDPERPKRQEIFDKVANLYPSLCSLWLYDKNGLFLYDNGVRLDLDFLIPQDLENWDLSKIKFIYDPLNKYQSKASETINKPSAAPKPKWRDEDGNMVDWFFWMFRQTYCYIKRGETNKRRSFNKLYSAQTSLNSIREKLIEMKIYLNGKWDYMNTIDQEFAGNMGATFSDFNPTNMAKATRKLFDLFEIIGKEYCKKINTDFPEGKVFAMRRLFDEFDEAQK